MLVEVALKAFIVLLVAAVAALVARRAAAATRHLVWTIAVVTVLALPLLVGLVPRSAVFIDVEDLGLPLVDELMAVPTDRREMPATASGAAGNAAPVDDVVVDLVPSAIGDEPGRAAAPAVATPLQTAPDIRRVAIGAWLLGGLVVLGLLVVERLRVAAVARHAERCVDGPVFARFDDLRRAAGLRRCPTLRVTAAGIMPMTWGVWRPVVLVPDDCRTWSDVRVDAVLRHELAHIRRRDDLVQLAATVMVALHWFNPLAWAAMYRLRVDREHACDDEVIGQGARPSTYAYELLELASLRGAHRSLLVGQSMARSSHLRQRLVAVLEDSRQRRLLTRRWVLLGVAGGLALTLPLASVVVASGPRAPETEAPDLRATVPAGMAQATATVSRCWSPDGGSRMQSNVYREIGERWEYVWRSDACEAEITLEGDLRFNDAFDEILGVSPGGRFRLELNEGATRRQLDVTTDAAGATAIVWRVDGQTRPYDAAAKRWLAEFLPQLLRSTGIAAAERVAAIYRNRGADGVFGEIDLMRSNSAKSRYLIALADQAGLGDNDRRRLLTVVRDGLSSNSNKSRVLVAFHERNHGSVLDAGIGATFWDAASSISSNSTTAGLLRAVVDGEPADSPLISRALDVAADRMSSNSTLAGFLRWLQQQYPTIATSGPHAERFWTVVGHISSGSTARQFLLDISAGATMDSRLLTVVLDTAGATLTSSSTLSRFLVSIEERYPAVANDGATADRFWSLVGRVNSSSTLRRLLLGLADGEADGARMLDRTLEAGRRGIGSSSELSRFLVAFVEQHTGAATGRLREALLEAAGAIGSRSTRERTLERLRALGVG